MEISEEKRPFEIICKKCELSFSKRGNLYRHMRNFHPEERTLIKKNQYCAMCTESFCRISQLHTHLQDEHDVSLKFNIETFYSNEDFLEWKKKIETETQSSFIVRTFTEDSELGVKTTYYICHRSGIVNSERNKRKRHAKVAGSVKCGYTCPAIIHVHKQTVDDICEIKVQYQSVHVGHDLEVGKLRLSKEDRSAIASSLRLGVPLSKILDDTRVKYSPTKRYCLTRKDLHNIKRDFKIEGNVILHKDDAVSVDILVKKIKNENENPVLLYKPLFEVLPDFPAVQKDEFLLGIMNEAQIKLLDSYGHSCIMIDSMHGLNQYGFQLTTLLVHDENHEGLPVAVLFSSRTASESLIPFFTEIKKQLPNFKTHVLMTDDTMSFYNAWQETFKDAPKHLLCSWHVNRSWIAKVNSKVKDDNNRIGIKEELKKLLYEMDVTTFEKLMNNFIEVYGDKEKDFINYFKTYYEKRPEKWAYCHRQRLGINTNTKIERWHRQLKYEESRGTLIKRLDKAIALVMNAIAKKLFSRIISMERGISFMMATKWGVVSAGKISHDFVTAVRSSPGDEHEFVAVAARNVNSAKEFASRHGIPKAYGSYEELAKNSDIEVVYIGTINSYHFSIGKLMLEHGKHVLMEKPMTLNVKQTKALIEIAQKHKRFLMEAVWSRFLPSYKHLMELLKDKVIGDVLHVNVNFGKPLMGIDRLMEKSQGGGTILDLGIYTINAVSMVYNGEKPKKIAAVGHLNEEGVDIAMTSSLLYSNNRTAQVTTNAQADFPCDIVITGTKGHLKIPEMMWCATTIQTPTGTLDFKLPDTILPCNFENSSGLMYEAMEVRKCLKEGLLESPIMPLRDSITLAEIMDEIRRQIGVTYDAD